MKNKVVEKFDEAAKLAKQKQKTNEKNNDKEK